MHHPGRPKTPSRALGMRFFAYALIALALPAAFGGALYLQALDHENEKMALEHQHDLQVRKTAIAFHLKQLGYSLMFLVDQVRLHQPLEDAEGRKIFAEDMLSFLNTTELFDQLRLLDLNGMEVARANYNNGKPYLVPADQLQDKSQRYYFQHTVQLGPGDMYVSRLDLNIEHGKVERPFKPTIRFCMPVFNQHGKKIGILVMNYLAEHLLQLLRSAHGQPVYLLDQDGYWLLAPEPAWEWGFMFPQRQSYTMRIQEPEIWTQLQQRESGHFEAGGLHYVHTAIYPLRAFAGIPTLQLSMPVEAQKWTMLIRYPDRLVLERTADVHRALLMWTAGFMLVMVTGAWFYAVAVEQSRQRASQLRFLADHDELTGLFSRRRFFDHLQLMLARARRFNTPFAVLYLDLDGFKQINDAHGHEAGDHALRTIGARILDCVREVDVVARLGGDEFAIVLDHIDNRSDAARVAEKLLAAISEPFHIDTCECRLGCSIGIALYPEDGQDTNALLTRADQAMYRAKHGGKNRYEFASKRNGS